MFDTEKLTKGEKTRLKIITQATKLFYKNGFEETTFAEIAKACGITQPALYAYFADKMAILYSCCVLAAEKGRQFIDAETSEEKDKSVKLDQYLMANMLWFQKKAESYPIFALYFFAAMDKKIHELFQNIRWASVKRIENLLIEGQAHGFWHIDDFTITADSIHSLMVGEVYKVYHDNSSAADIKKRLKHFHKLLV